MKLIECYIEGFGKISKEKISFRDGLNCFREDNGSGKTTLASFIKVMFYGMSDTKKANLDENERKHYLPWNGGPCGGSLTFYAGGKVYRIERSFAPKAADDKFTLYDTTTGRECTDYPENVGEALFGIDADGFERTVFLSERALTAKSDNRSISAKLSDLVGCDGDIGGMDDAMKVLENQRKFYHKKGGSGEISDIQARIDELTRRLNSLQETENALEGVHNKMKEIRKQISEARADDKNLLKDREAATIRVAEHNHDRHYAELKEKLEEAIRRRAFVCEMFGSEIPTFIDIDEASYKATEAKNLTKSVEDTPETREFNRLADKYDGKIDRYEIANVKDAIEKIRLHREKENDPKLQRARKIFVNRVPTEDEINSVEQIVVGPQKKGKFIFAITAVLSFGLAIAGMLLPLNVLAIIGTALMMCSLVAFIIMTSKELGDQKKAINDFFTSVSGVSVREKDEILARLDDMKKHLPHATSVLTPEEYDRMWRIVNRLSEIFPEILGKEPIKAAEEIITEYERYAELAVAERYMRGDRNARLDRAEKLMAEADRFVKKYKTRTSDPYNELRTALTEYNRLTAEIIAKRDEMSHIESLHKLGESEHRKAMQDIENVDKQRQANEELIESLSREYTLTERLYNSYMDELESRDEYSMRRAELEETLAKYKDNYETIQLTKKYITQAKDNITSKYLGKTIAGFLKYNEAISGMSDEQFEMDTDFGVTKQVGGTTKPVDAFSKGTKDLYNLASRLALIDSLYEKENPFLILDDPFTAFDDKKTKAALKMIREFSKERQIIYFTCSDSRRV